MNSLADNLPPEIARQIHPDWRKNEAGYWALRDQLLAQYRDQWIGFADGAVIAACKTSLEVFHTPGVVERHPFVICVGREDEPYRIRRAAFAYDTAYPGQALPLINAEFRSVSGSAGLLLDRVIRTEKVDGQLFWGWCDGEEKTEGVSNLQKESSVARRRRERSWAVLQKVLPQAEATRPSVAQGEDRPAVNGA
jgi:uncharacterized protein YcaQ